MIEVGDDLICYECNYKKGYFAKGVIGTAPVDTGDDGMKWE